MIELLNLCELAVETALKFGADEAEAFLTRGREISVRAEANELKLATSHAADGLGIRVFSDRALGFASVNVFDEQTIEETVQMAVSLSKATPQDEHNVLPEPRPIKTISGLYDDQAQAFGMDQAITQMEEMLAAARNYDSRVMIDSALVNAAIATHAVMNSKGIKAEEQRSLFSHFIMGMARDNEEVSSFNHRFDSARRASELDGKKTAMEFARSVVASLGATRGESFAGTIILSPDAVLELMIGPIIWAVSANNVQKGMSRWAGMAGKEVASPMLTIEDNGQLAGGACSASFDREGLPHTHLTIIQDGVLQNYLYNSYTARKEGRGSTGHASGGTRSVPAIGPTNLTIKHGEQSKEELIGEVERGILVTRFSSSPNPVSGDVSGVVKGGFLIEHGKLTRPLIETMFSGNLFEFLSKLSGLSRETERLAFPQEVGLVSPYIRIDDVAITAG